MRSKCTPKLMGNELQGYQRPVQTEDLEKAQNDQVEAEVKLDLLKLTKEARLWQSYLQNLRMFNAETHRDKVEQQEVSRQRSGIDKLLVAEVSKQGCAGSCSQAAVPATTCQYSESFLDKIVLSDFNRIAGEHIQCRFPHYEVKTVADIPATATTAAFKFAMDMKCEASRCHRVYVLNLTFFGNDALNQSALYIRVLKDKLAADPERTCVLIIASNVGSYKMTYDETSAEKVRRDIFDMLADKDNHFRVKNVTGIFEIESLRSKTRRSKHEVGVRCS